MVVMLRITDEHRVLRGCYPQVEAPERPKFYLKVYLWPLFLAGDMVRIWRLKRKGSQGR